MIHSQASYKRFSCVGPGGRKCSCCYPPPGKFRRMIEKKVKRTEKQIALKEFEVDLDELKFIKEMGVPF